MPRVAKKKTLTHRGKRYKHSGHMGTKSTLRINKNIKELQSWGLSVRKQTDSDGYMHVFMRATSASRRKLKELNSKIKMLRGK